jgi:heat shock protein HtpX
MQMFKRFGLFLLTNILVMVTVSIAFRLIIEALGLTRYNAYYSYIMVFSLVWGMGGAFISLWISKFMAKTMYGIEIINENTAHPELRWVVETVHRISQRAGLTKMPEVGVYESFDVNAFATGPSRNNSLVAVSSGLLQRMNRDEIEGVLAHEVAHIANGDMVTMTLIQGVVNAFVLFFSQIIAKLLASNTEEKNRGWVEYLTYIVAQIVFSILGSIVVNYFSRAREFRADYGSSQYLGRQKMIAALRKLQAIYESPSNPDLETDNGAVATLMISSRSRGMMGLFRTHPDLEERIAALQGAANT